MSGTSTTRIALERLSKDDLVHRASTLDVPTPRHLTKPELIDEILKREVADESARDNARGLFGVARDMLNALVARGLNLPDAIRRMPSLPPPEGWASLPRPLPTLTLAEIYAAQGLLARSLEVLAELSPELLNLPENADRVAALQRALTHSPEGSNLVAPAADASDDSAADAASVSASSAGAASLSTLSLSQVGRTLQLAWALASDGAVAESSTTAPLQARLLFTSEWCSLHEESVVLSGIANLHEIELPNGAQFVCATLTSQEASLEASLGSSRRSPRGQPTRIRATSNVLRIS